MKTPNSAVQAFSHAQLCDVAVKWLKRPHSAGGPGCLIAISEVATGWTGEIPDAIGFSLSHWETGATVVEVKVSRSDFLADRRKPHRLVGGVGAWRYYMAPRGLIRLDELPAGWGLIEVTPGGICRVQAGAMADVRKLGYDALQQQVERWKHHYADRDREQWLLVKLLARLGDVEKLNRDRRDEYAIRARLNGVIEEQAKTISAQRRTIYKVGQLERAALKKASNGEQSSLAHRVGN